MENIQVAPSRITSRLNPTTLSGERNMFWKKPKEIKKSSIYTNSPMTQSGYNSKKTEDCLAQVLPESSAADSAEMYYIRRPATAQ